MDPQVWLRIGGVSGAAAVAFGAFGAHALKGKISDERIMKAFETGAHYHLIHSVAMLACPFVKNSHYAGGLFLTGICLFSGSLYIMGITQNRKWGMVTPFGGLAFMGGWAALAMATLRI